MFTIINGTEAATNILQLVHQYNQEGLAGGLISETHNPIGHIEFIITGDLYLNVKVGEDTLRLPIVKLSVDFMSNLEYEWMLSKKGAEFSIDKQDTNM